MTAVSPPATVEDRLRDYILSEYPSLDPAALTNGSSLTGVLDSLAVLGVVGFIETEFQVEVSPDDLTEENFATVGSIAALVRRIGA